MRVSFNWLLIVGSFTALLLAACTGPDPTLAPTGTRTAVQTPTPAATATSLPTLAPTPVSTASTAATPTAMPTLARIAFISDRNGKHGDDNADIYVMDADGSNLTRITQDSAADTAPAWSPDGSKIVFASDRDGNFGIYVMDADGSNQTRLTDNSAADTAPAWSPDGSKIVFASHRDGYFESYVMDANGSHQTRLTKTDGESCTRPGEFMPLAKRMGYIQQWEWEPAWSPDGSKIAFASASGCHPLTIPIRSFIPYSPRKNANAEIYVTDADGSNQTRLTNNLAFDGWPSWSLDGTKIAFESDRDGNSEIYVMDADGSSQTRITIGGGSSPAWSPDGNKIAFESDRDGNMDIYVMDADGSNLTRITHDSSYEAFPTWSPGIVR